MSDQHDPSGLVRVDPEVVTQALLRAIQFAAQKATLEATPQAMDDAGKAALSFTQALVLMDPTLGQNGVPLAHEKAMQDEQLRQQAQRRAQAPTPARGVKP